MAFLVDGKMSLTISGKLLLRGDFLYIRVDGVQKERSSDGKACHQKVQSCSKADQVGELDADRYSCAAL